MKFKRMRKKKFSLLRYITLLVVWMILGMSAFIIYCLADFPDLYTLNKKVQPGSIITILDREDEVVAIRGNIAGEPVTFDTVPDILVLAILATEDQNFFDHPGIDMKAILRATIKNIIAHRIVQGGSTITQQLAKMEFLNAERTLKRKIQEAVLALYLENTYSKSQILTLYLNKVYMGAGIYGVSGAAKFYFGKDIKNITLPEAAIIAGLLKAPSRYSPLNSIENALGRMRVILKSMYEYNLISKAQYEHALKEKIHIQKSAMGKLQYSYIIDWVLEQIPPEIRKNNENIVVHTTIDYKLQQVANHIIVNAVADHKKTNNVQQGALVVMDKKGAVLAMVGGTNYSMAPYNRAVKAQRQPGSSFKTFVYANAFEHGAKLEDKFIDKPIQIGKWAPRNNSRKYAGEVTILEAFADSLNTVVVQVAEQYGLENTAEIAHRMGIKSPISAVPSMALGTSELNLLELTGSYAVIANGGDKVVPYIMTEITDAKTNDVLYSRVTPENETILNEYTVQELNHALHEVVTNGSGYRIKTSFPVAGKTGTTQDSRDAWFIGYSSGIVAGIWFGNDDNSPMKNVGGAGLAAVTWGQFMEQSHKIWAHYQPVEYVHKPIKSKEDDISDESFFDKVISIFSDSKQ